MIIVWVWSLGVVLYCEPLRMSENVLDPPLPYESNVVTVEIAFDTFEMLGFTNLNSKPRKLGILFLPLFVDFFQ